MNRPARSGLVLTGGERHAAVLAVAAMIGVIAAPVAADDACHKVLNDRIQRCAEPCIARAKAAVAPEIRDRVRGVGCFTNCAKLEMFAGHACPEEAKPR